MRSLEHQNYLGAMLCQAVVLAAFQSLPGAMQQAFSYSVVNAHG